MEFVLDNKSISPAYCLLACSLSLLIFSDASLAASVDTGKVQPKITKIPPPTVKAPVQPQPQPPKTLISPTVITGTVTTSPPPQAPKAIVKTPTYNVRPKTQVKLPPPTVRPNTNVKHPPQTVQPRVNVPTPNQKVQTLDPRYAPKMAPGPSATTPRPGQDLHAPVATPGSPATNALGGSKIDSQTLDRIQGIQEAATAAEVFDQINKMKELNDSMNIGAGSSGRPGGQTGALGDAGDHLGIGAVGGDSSSSASRNQSGMGVIDRSGPADPAAGSGAGAPGSSLDTSRQGWVSDATLESTTTSDSADGTTTSSKATYLNSDGTTTVTIIEMGESGGSETIVTLDKDGEILGTSHSVEDGSINKSWGEGKVNLEAYGRGWYTPDQGDSNPNENYDNKKYNDCVKGQGGCAKENRTKPTPRQMTGQPSKGDADTGEGSSTPSVGTAAVTNENEFFSRGGSGGGGVRGKDWATDPEEAFGGGAPVPAPSGATLDEAMGAVD